MEMTCPGIKGVSKNEYSWKVVKATIDPDKFEIEFFRSDLDLLDYLEFVLESCDAKGYCDYNGGSLEELIIQASKVGNEMIDNDLIDQVGYCILEVIKLK